MSFILHKVSFDEKDETKQFNFNTENMKKDIIFSIIIGANGTGKSLFLEKLIELFRNLHQQLKSEALVKPKTLEYYNITYELDGHIYSVERNSREIIFGKNTSRDNIKIPDSILALTFLVEDKFTYRSQEDNSASMYKYLGIRSTANAVFSGSINKKIRSILFDCVDEKSFRDKVVKTFDLLGYEPIVKMKFEHTLKSMVTQRVGIRTLNSRIKTISNKSKYLNNKLEMLTEDDKNDILKYIADVKKIRNKDSKSKTFTELIIDFRETERSYHKYQIVKNMIISGLLDPAEIEISQKNSKVDSEALSSGEKNLLYITLNILANVKNNSLIVIDEPEISLHPNWQIKYNMHLKQILSGFKNIHIIIATHSHFLLSGIKKEESNVFHIKKDKTIRRIEEDVIGWSPENILYNVFGMASTRNYYFERDLKQLVYYISNESGSIEEISGILEKLEKFNIVDDDPLMNVIIQGKKYLEKRLGSV